MVTLPFFDPQGNVRMVPADQAQAASQAGGKKAVKILDPQGTARWIPEDQQQAALNAGGKLPPPPAPTAPTASFNAPPSTSQQLKNIFQHPLNMLDQVAQPVNRPRDASVGEMVGADLSNVLAGAAGVIRHPLDTLGNVISGAFNTVTDPVGTARQIYQQGMTNGPQTGAVMLGQGLVLPSLMKATEPVTAPIVRAGVNAAKTVEEVVPTVLRAGANILAGTTPKVAQELGEQIQTANQAGVDASAKVAQAHLTNTQDALDEQRGRELGYKNAVNSKSNDIQLQQLNEVNRVAADHAQAVQDANAHNQQVIQKHQEAVQRVTQANQAAEQTAAMRAQLADRLQQETEKYYAQEDAANAKTKGEENAAWQSWRQKMQGATVDGGEISAPLKKLAAISPDVERALHQLEPRGDEVPPDSPYRQLQDTVAKGQGAADYQSMSPLQQQGVDRVLASMGEEPPSIDFNPEQGKPIPVEQIHRANSILQRYIASGRYEGPLLGEMKQVARVLRSAVTKASDANGALDDLNAARQSTVKYQQSFGRERGVPTTVEDMREKQANPEAFKERDDQARLDAASRVDPTLVDSFNRVKNLREQMKALPTEDALRKGQKQAPAPPTVGDLRPGYRLKPIPQPPQKLLATPAIEQAQQVVAPPDRPTFPQRPDDFVPQRATLEDIQKAKQAAMEQQADWVRKHGTLVSAGYGAYELIRSVMKRDPRGVINSIGQIGAGLAGTGLVAKLLENPRFIRLMTAPTPSDIAAMPADVRAVMPQLVKEAQAKGIKVHPALLGIGAPVASQASQTQ